MPSNKISDTRETSAEVMVPGAVNLKVRLILDIWTQYLMIIAGMDQAYNFWGWACGAEWCCSPCSAGPAPPKCTLVSDPRWGSAPHFPSHIWINPCIIISIFVGYKIIPCVSVYSKCGGGSNPCQHLCLLSTQGPDFYSCQCSLGYRPDSNGCTG